MWRNVEVSLYSNIFEKEGTTKHAVNHGEHGEWAENCEISMVVIHKQRERERKSDLDAEIAALAAGINQRQKEHQHSTEK